MKEGFCELHYLAREKLNRNYALWKKAYGDLSYNDYLQNLIALPGTGKAALSVARLFLRSKGEGIEKNPDNL